MTWHDLITRPLMKTGRRASRSAHIILGENNVTIDLILKIGQNGLRHSTRWKFLESFFNILINCVTALRWLSLSLEASSYLRKVLFLRLSLIRESKSIVERFLLSRIWILLWLNAASSAILRLRTFLRIIESAFLFSRIFLRSRTLKIYE